MSRRARNRIKPGYVWGALSNTEPPDDEDPHQAGDCAGVDGCEPDMPPDDQDSAAAEDQWVRWRDATAAQ